MIKLVVGLGNPGIEYEFTRHNIAWILLDQIKELQSNTWKKKFKGLYTQNSQKVFFLKPETYMNLSGQSVQALCSFYQIRAEEVLVVQDEVDLDFGVLQFKNGGGLAGHNGLKSIAQGLGTNEFLRLRLGVGRPVHGTMSSWVLSAFKNDEIIALEQFMDRSVMAIEDCLKEDDFLKIQNKYNKKK
jgi:PTH1 family peptidyl-tRNA hydrolase